MSESATPEPDHGIGLEAYCFAASRVARGTGGAGAFPRREWVLLDEHDCVQEVFGSDERAVGELNQRFDTDPTTVERLRLVVLDDGEVAFDMWPRGGSPAERAGALAWRLSSQGDLEDRHVDDLVRWHFLRAQTVGSARLAGEQRRCVELSWYAPDGEHEPVGLLVERLDEGAWQLLLDGRSRGLSETQLHQRIAQVMNTLGDGRWTQADVTAVRTSVEADGPATRLMGPAVVCVQAQLLLAEHLHVREPLGRVWP